MHHNVYGIQVTADAVEDMLSSTPDDQASQVLARRLLRSLLSPLACIVTAETLNAIEALWTGRDKECEWDGTPHDKFIARFCILSYFKVGCSESARPRPQHHLGDSPPPAKNSGHWQQIHELSFIAIAVDAIGALNQHANLFTEDFVKNHENRSVTESDLLISFFKSDRHASVKRCLAAAVDRQMIEPSSDSAKTSAKSRCMDVRFLPWFMYGSHLVGRKEPSVKYLRISKHYGEWISTTTVTSDTPAPVTSIPEADSAVLVVGEEKRTKKSAMRSQIFLSFPPQSAYHRT
jgi:hypothetical protein